MTKKASKKPKRKPSIRAERTAQILAGNGGKSVGAAMREAGYSKSSADTPSKLTNTLSWPELMDKYLPRKSIAAAHKKLVSAEKSTFVQVGGEIIEKKSPDNAARNKAVDMAYKLRGEFAPEQIEVKGKFKKMSGAELSAFIKTASDKLLKK